MTPPPKNPPPPKKPIVLVDSPHHRGGCRVCHGRLPPIHSRPAIRILRRNRPNPTHCGARPTVARRPDITHHSRAYHRAHRQIFHPRRARAIHRHRHRRRGTKQRPNRGAIGVSIGRRLADYTVHGRLDWTRRPGGSSGRVSLLQNRAVHKRERHHWAQTC